MPTVRLLSTVGGVTDAIVIGVATRTGAAVAVALGGSATGPAFCARREIALVPGGLNPALYHEAAGMELADGDRMVGRITLAAERAAATGLRALAGMLPAGAVRDVAVVVKPVSAPDELAAILRSHAWQHAAEGRLYRLAVIAAAAECGWTPHAVDESALPLAEHSLVMIGQAAGRPWRRIEKDAARAAIAVLSS